MNLPNLTAVMNLIRCLIREPATEFTSNMEAYLLAKLDEALEDYKKENSAYQHYVYKQRLLNFLEEERSFILKKDPSLKPALPAEPGAIPLVAISSHSPSESQQEERKNPDTPSVSPVLDL
jgi:hypothetical protein